MIIYIAFDDTDSLDCGRGTGKLARWFAEQLPPDCVSLGVVRQQLLHRSDIPMTSHNSSLTVIVEVPDISYKKDLIDMAARHIRNHFVEGSDPGLCVVEGNSDRLDHLAEFGQRCTCEKVSMDEAWTAAKGVHLSGHGGEDTGIIGAAAGVGLTYRGNSGRFVEYRDIRELPDITKVCDLTERDMHVISVNRHAEIPAPEDIVYNHGSLRPRLFSGKAVVPVIYDQDRQRWQTINEKRNYNSSFSV